MDPRWLLIYLNPEKCIEGVRVRLSIRKTHHRDDVGDTVSAVDDGARQRPLSHLSGRPGGC